MSRTIVPIKLTEFQFINQIKSLFGLNEKPFNNIDSDLLLLAFIPTCTKDPKILTKGTSVRLQRKFGVCNHQTLEFYGDRILYDAITYIIYDLFGVDSTPELLTNIFNLLSSNRFLTDIMIDKDACKFVRSDIYNIAETRTRFHNICADSLEALVGALFVHLNQNKLDHSVYIRD